MAQTIFICLDGFWLTALAGVESAIFRRTTNFILYWQATNRLRYLLTITERIHHVYLQCFHPELSFLRRCTALRNFSRIAGNHWGHVRQRYQLHPSVDGIRPSWPASTLDQCFREILYATLQHTTSSNATDNPRAPSPTPARYGPADRQQPTACTTGSH